MAKKRYRIESGSRGGEVCIGKVNEGFVDHFIDEEEHELVEYVTGLGWEEEEPEDALVNPDGIPIPKKDFDAWYDCDEIEHLNSAYSDDQWTYTEVPADGTDDYAWEGAIDFNPVHLYGREAYIDDVKPDDMTDYQPVMTFMSEEKGGFGAWFVDTDGEDFNPKKVAFSSTETSLYEMVNDCWYDKELLECDYDNNDTTGKGYCAKVGYMNMKWHDSDEKYTDEYLVKNDFWECYEEELEES